MTSLYQTSGGTGINNTGAYGSDSAGVWAYNLYATFATTLPSSFTGGATLQLEVWYNGGVTNPANFGAQEAASSVSGLSALESIAALGGTGSPPASIPDLADFVPGDGQITSFSLTGQEIPPSITTQPQSVVVNINGTASFSVTASGSALTYQWLENNLPLASQTNLTLVLTNVSTNNAAENSVVVSNAVGVVTSLPATLTVQPAPIITVQPQSQSVWGALPLLFRWRLLVNRFGLLVLVPCNWLRADTGVITHGGGQVSQWQDQSGNANHASQANTNLQPTLVSATGLGGRAVVRFNGIQNNVNGSYLNGTGNVGVPGALTAFTVYNAFSTTNNDNLLWSIGIPGQSGASRISMIVGGRLRRRRLQHGRSGNRKRLCQEIAR